MESPLPAGSLYGEQAHGMPAVDRLHCESIAERSRLHQWQIGVHRHESLFQLFWIARGGCEASIDGKKHHVDGPALMVLPATVVHGFSFDPKVEGLVITVQAQHLRQLLSHHDDLAKRLGCGSVWPLGSEESVAVARAATGLQEEFGGSDQRWRAAALDSALLRLLIACGRHLELPPAEGLLQARSQRPATGSHLRRYQDLIEQHFRHQPALSALACQLGISSTQLNRICRKALGRSALAVLQARVLLEAQRELAYTTMSIKQIAHGLGFVDQAYFARFYQRQTGLAPTAWRRQCAGGNTPRDTG